MRQTSDDKQTFPISETHKQQAISINLPVSTLLFLGFYETLFFCRKKFRSVSASSSTSVSLSNSSSTSVSILNSVCEAGEKLDLSSSKSDSDDGSGSCRFLVREGMTAKRVVFSFSCIRKNSFEGRSLLMGALLLRETVVKSGEGD